jgi:hypothetical protein
MKTYFTRLLYALIGKPMPTPQDGPDPKPPI